MPDQSTTSDTRAQILRATIRLIGEGGLAGVTNRRVAGEAGVSLSAMTYYFESQSHLLRESLELFIDDETTQLAELARQLKSVELTEDAAAAGLQTLLSSAPERRIAKLELYLLATRDPELRVAALNCFASYDELAHAALESLGVPDPEAAAQLLVAVIDGLQLRRLVAGDETLAIAQPLTKLIRALQSQP